MGWEIIMAQWTRYAFPNGWQPSSDALNASPEAVLRMDNMVLDEQGILALRLGSSKVNSSALATTDIRALYTNKLSGVRYRLAQGAGSVYAAADEGDFASIDSGFDTALDVKFTSYLGQIFYGSGTNQKKYDGTSRNWGLAAPSAAPTIASIATSNKVFATCNSGESGWTDNEAEAAATNVAGFDGTGNGARQVQAKAAFDSFRAVMSRDLGSSTDFTDYGASVLGSKEDLIEMYVKIDEPERMNYITLTVDANGSSAATFDRDYFVFTWLLNRDLELKGDISLQLSDDYVAEAYAISDTRSRADVRPGFAVTIRPEAGGWHYLSVRRDDFLHVRTTDGAGWDTVRGIRVAFGGAGQPTVAFDRIRMIGGDSKPLSGTYVYRAIHVREMPAYNALGVSSDQSSEIVLKSEGATVTVQNPTDTQATHIWLYRMGGLLDGFYRVARSVVASYSGTVAITDSLSDKDALVLDIRLETDNTLPPDNIVGITDDYYGRIMVLTSDGKVYPSRRLNPESFSAGQTFRVAGASETPYWIKKAFGGIYVGTSRDIYRISGDGAEFPDGTTNFTLEPGNINSPPINSSLSSDGSVLIYMADDGPRLFSGESSSSLRGSTDLLWRGYTRHGVSPVNMTGGRFRMAIANGLLTMIVPEGDLTTTTGILWRYHLGLQQWYRHSYGRNWRSLYREPDGSLVAGDNSGFVWLLDDATASGDDGTDISVDVRSKVDDFGLPFHLKKGENLVARLDTGPNSGTLAIHFDGSDTPTASGSPDSNWLTKGQSLFSINLSATGTQILEKFRQLQWRLSGSFSTLKYYGFTVQYVQVPESVEVFDSGSIDFPTHAIVFVRSLRLKAQTSVALTMTPFLDGAAQATKTIQPISSEEAIYDIPLGREMQSAAPRFVFRAPAGSTFEPYWLECTYRVAGKLTQKKVLRIRAA
jgi:hypothetical protein